MKTKKPGRHICLFVLQLLSMTAFNVANASVLESPCEAGWTFFGTSCYKAFYDTLTWTNAKHECEAKKAHLVTFSSAEENEFVFQNFAKGKTVWIGLYRNPVEFAWVTEESVSFTNWIDANGNDVQEKCVEMTDYSSFNGQWNDISCSTNRLIQGFICERDHYVTGLFNITKGVAMENQVISESKIASDIECVLQCLQTFQCKSVNLYSSQSFKYCQLNNASSKDKPGNVIYDDQAVLYERIYQ